MSDFHRSLDRSLEHDPHTHWGVEGDALADLLAARDLMEAQPLRCIPDSWSYLGYTALPFGLVTLPLCEHEIPAKGTE
jgi:hypothetical protein